MEIWDGILALFGSGLGAIVRFVPEIFRLFGNWMEQKHEMAMTELQLKIDVARSKLRLDEIHAQGEADATVAEIQTLSEALRSQGRATGIRWVDAINATVRPFITYWWMILLTIHKIGTTIQAWNDTESIGEFSSAIWTAQDWAILGTILGFWFVDRAIRKNNGY